MPKIFALVDCNNFYVSCERIFDPSLEGRAVVVVSGVGGCALARSNEAKKLGILMSQPYFEWKNVAEKNSVKIFTPNFPLYGDMSNRVMQTLSQFSDVREVYSIDECFLDLTHIEVADLVAYGAKIRKIVKQITGIPVSVGIAQTKTLAKVANEIGKKDPKHGGVVDLTKCADLTEILKSITVEDVWGIGRQTATKLHIANVHTAQDFVNLDGEYVHKKYGIGFYHTWLELRGKPCERASQTLVENKSIACTRTFARPAQDKKTLASHITQFASHAAEKLRGENLETKYVTLFVRTSRFVERNIRYSKDITIALNEASDYTPDIVGTALAALDKIFSSGYLYKKAGVVLSGFSEKSAKQLGLMGVSEAESKRRERLMRTIDSLNAAHGAQTIHLASTQSDSSQNSAKKVSHRSPRYTSHWSEIKRI